jgi:hypothetical protein
VRFLRQTLAAPIVAFVVSNLERVRYLACEQPQHRGFVAAFRAARFLVKIVIASTSSLLSKRHVIHATSFLSISSLPIDVIGLP